MTALSLESGYIVPMAVPHMIINAFKNVCGIALETDYKLEALEAAKNAAPAKAAVDSSKPAAKAAVVEEKVEEEEDVDMGGLFGDF